jgi:DNA-binding SARP family transcriptional activator/DNA-binding HxlR family transcriptional regulator
VVCKSFRDTNCSAVRALEAVSEQWSPLIIQDALFNGTTQFSDFEVNLEIAPDVLSSRLNGFIDSGLMELRRNYDHPNRQEYLLTEMGRDLAPMMIALSQWGDRWLEQDGDTVHLEHAECGGILEQLIRCSTCGESPALDNVRPRPDPEADTGALVAALDTSELNLQQEPSSDIANVSIDLLGAFAVRISGKTASPLSMGTQKILAYLAMHDRPVTRLSMAGTMWPEVSEQHAGGSLRSALSRLDKSTRETILLASSALRLDDHVVVDFRQAKDLAHRLIRADHPPADIDLDSEAVATLSQDLLPEWYDEWVVTEAEDWRHLRLNGLEAQAGFLTEQDRWSEATEACRAAIVIDPLRESSQARLIEVHLARGNQSEALRAYEAYRLQLMTDLGLEPTAHLSELVRGIQRS